MSEQVSCSLGITIPSPSTQYGSVRVDLGLTLNLKPKEKPQQAIERIQKEIMQYLKTSKQRKTLNQLDNIISNME